LVITGRASPGLELVTCKHLEHLVLSLRGWGFLVFGAFLFHSFLLQDKSQKQAREWVTKAEEEELTPDVVFR